MAQPDDQEPRAPARAVNDDVEPRLDLLYREQAPRLQRRLSRRLRSSEDARDLVQDAFAKLWGARARSILREPEALLNRIVRNLLIDRSRRLRTQARHEPIGEDNAPTVRPTQADGIELEQMRARYRAAVDTLPQRARTVFLLHRIDGLAYKEIAVRLGISVRTVEWHFADALMRIGKSLDAQ